MNIISSLFRSFFKHDEFVIHRLGVLFIVVIFGCTTNPDIAKAMTPQLEGLSVPGKIVWHDLFTHDLESSSRFYEELFGWSFIKAESGNTNNKQIYSGDNHIGNAIEIKPLSTNVNESQWLNYMSVANVDEAAILIKNDHGRIQTPTRKPPHGERIAVCLDSQKAVFAIIEASKNVSMKEQIILYELIGSELWTNNIDEAERFYGNLVDYTLQTTNMKNGEKYQAFLRNEQIMAGVVKIPFFDVQPNWVPYIAVKNTMAVTEKVLQLGGQILTEPDRDQPENAAVIIADPSGAVFGIQQIIVVNSYEGGVNKLK